MYMIEPRFKTRVMTGLFGAIGFIYFYNNPDNFDAVKVYVKNVCFSSYNSLSGFFKFNLYPNRLITANEVVVNGSEDIADNADNEDNTDNTDNANRDAMIDEGNSI